MPTSLGLERADLVQEEIVQGQVVVQVANEDPGLVTRALRDGLAGNADLLSTA